MLPRNLTKSDVARLRKRAKKMLELKALKWSQNEIADAMNISRNMVRKTFSAVDGATEGSLYWEL